MPSPFGPPTPGIEMEPQALATTSERERWSRVKAIFIEALDYDGEERLAFLDRACAGSDELRREVDSLLSSDRAAASFCETPAATMLATGASALADGARLQAGTRLGNYVVERFVAAGGMGQVYQARHVVLNREVAIKTVSANDQDPSARRRLIREAQHAATLAHPNICRVYEVGDEGGLPFIVMELVSGRPLAEIVRGKLPAVADALVMGVQIVEAIEFAHGQGLLHRDLKSSNVIVDDRGRPVILDFGLAKRMPEPGLASIEPTNTTPGLAGTLSYMAPEVLQGQPATPRSDIWSLGVLLFELFTGELPFTGRTPYETSSAILVEPPRRMSSRVPLAIRLVVERCLAKDPAARYQRAQDVRDALERIRRRDAWPVVGRLLITAGRRTIAGVLAAVVLLVLAVTFGPRLRDYFDSRLAMRVATLVFLPFENASGDSVEYYASGVTDALVAQLGSIADVRIVSPHVVVRDTGTATSRAALAQRYGADAIVQGRVRKTGDRVAVDIHLIEPKRGRVVWSDRFERSAREVLVLHSDIVKSLAAEVRLAARPGAAKRAPTTRTVNADAYEAYLRGRFEYNKRTRESLRLAVDHFQRAVELDPTYAPAHAALADCYNQFATVMIGYGSPREFRPRAAAEAIQALQIDPYSAEAHATLGYVRHYDWQWDDAEAEFKRAIELDPSYALAHIWYANLLMSRHEWQGALEQAELARQLDPYSLIVNTNVAWILTFAGRYDEAIVQLRKTLAIDSTYWHAHWRLIDPLVAKRRYPEALREASILVELVDSAPSALALLAGIEAKAGDTAAARRHLRRLLDRGRSEYIPPASLGGLYAALGDRENALRYLRLQVDERSNSLVYLTVDTLLAKQNALYRGIVGRLGPR